MSNADCSTPDRVEPGAIVLLMEMALSKSGAGYLYQCRNLDVVAFANLPVSFPNLTNVQDRPTSGSPDEILFGQQEGARLAALKQTVINDGNSVSTEIDMQTPAGVQTYRIDLERVDGLPQGGVLSVITDVSETRHRERVLKTLLRELSHRSKNLLAIIQGIATQTARQARSLDSFLTKFRGRIQSLASSQDLVTDSSWRGAYLFALAERQFAAYWPDPGARIDMTGINAHLSPNAALHVGLALHELIVNSASHGTIAAGVNALKLNCTATWLDDQEAIEFSWIEPLVTLGKVRDLDEPTFARTVLERVVPVAINGKATYSVTSARIEYHLTIPRREYEIHSNALQ